MIEFCLRTCYNIQVNLLFNKLKENKFIFSSSSLAKHKWCTATVTLREGIGKVTIKSPNVKTSVNDILYFTRIIHRLDFDFIYLFIFNF
jgi:hypothetical protein